MSKAAAILGVLALAGVAAVSSTSCLVDRRTPDLKCQDDSTCVEINGGVCDRGYCVEASQAACPPECPACDPGAMTCPVTCSAGQPCDVACPDGFDCEIRCNNANPCGPITCVSGACNITCIGQSACPSIDCSGSCRCDVSCNIPGACPSVLICPMTGTGEPCADPSDGSCTSQPAGCDTCSF